MRLVVTVVVGAALVVCAGCMSIPETHHYAVSAPVPPEGPPPSGPLIAIEELAVDAAYEDPSIVYRPTPHRLERYNYHRWTASPGALVSSYLRDALSGSGCFRAVVEDVHPDTTAILSGRVLAFEEVDVSESDWRGRLAVELRLVDPVTGELLWTRRYRDSEPLVEQSPAGLAQALERALSRLVARSVPELLGVLAERTDEVSACSLAPDKKSASR